MTRASQQPPLDLAGALTRRMAPILLVLAAIVAVSAPTAYHLVRVGELRARGDLLATELARRLGTEARARPALWSYDSSKVLDHLRAFRLQQDLRGLRVYDAEGRLVARRALGPRPRGPVVWSRATIEGGTNGTPGAGEVWVAVSVAQARTIAALLLLPFSLLGLALATVLHLLPRRALSRAEAHIAQLIAALESSRARLATRGEELEAQVGERIQELRHAYEELRDRDERRRELSGRAIALQEADRRAIARDLHDAAGQTLTAVRLNLQLLEQQADSPARVRAQVAATLGQVDTVMEEVRRAVWALGPAVVHELGLSGALRRHCQALAEQSGLEVEHDIDPALDGHGAAVETVCYRLVQEALTNVVRHARASRVRVSLRRVDIGGVAQLELSVRDDGRGLPPERREDRPGRGLAGMQERIELLGGALTIESTAGAGTTVRARLPIEPTNSAATDATGDGEGLHA